MEQPTIYATNAPAVMTQAELDEREATIRAGLDTFQQVGLALLDIRDQRGYAHLGYGTFEDYMRGRWEWSKQHGYQLVEQAQVAHGEPHIV